MTERHRENDRDKQGKKNETVLKYELQNHSLHDTFTSKSRLLKVILLHVNCYCNLPTGAAIIFCGMQPSVIQRFSIGAKMPNDTE